MGFTVLRRNRRSHSERTVISGFFFLGREPSRESIRRTVPSADVKPTSRDTNALGIDRLGTG